MLPGLLLLLGLWTGVAATSSALLLLVFALEIAVVVGLEAPGGTCRAVHVERDVLVMLTTGMVCPGGVPGLLQNVQRATGQAA